MGHVKWMRYKNDILSINDMFKLLYFNSIYKPCLAAHNDYDVMCGPLHVFKYVTN